MIGSPFYRLLIAASLVLSGGAVTARFSHAEPKDPCENRRHVYACAILDGAATATAPYPGQAEVSVVAAAGTP